MNAIAHHGYLFVALILFCSAAGVPLPASVALLVAGAAAASHLLSPEMLVLTAICAALLGDTLLFLGGKHTGWWLLALLCRVSINPESCIFTSADYFYRRGARTLMFSKFIPGLGSMAAPLAGSLNMRFTRFLRLDAFNVTLYCVTWLSIGYFFHGFITQIEMTIAAVGHVFGILVLLLIVAYACMFTYFALQARRFRTIERVPVAEVAERLSRSGPERPVIIADVRSHGYYDPGMHRIKNSIRIEPSRLTFELLALQEFMEPECEVFVYCSCARESTSARVADMLRKQNCNVKVIEGGLKAWQKAGCPVEPIPAADVEHLPRFN